MSMFRRFANYVARGVADYIRSWVVEEPIVPEVVLEVEQGVRPEPTGIGVGDFDDDDEDTEPDDGDYADSEGEDIPTDIDSDGGDESEGEDDEGGEYSAEQIASKIKRYPAEMLERDKIFFRTHTNIAEMLDYFNRTYLANMYRRAIPRSIIHEFFLRMVNYEVQSARLEGRFLIHVVNVDPNNPINNVDEYRSLSSYLQFFVDLLQFREVGGQELIFDESLISDGTFTSIKTSHRWTQITVELYDAASMRSHNEAKQLKLRSNKSVKAYHGVNIYNDVRYPIRFDHTGKFCPKLSGQPLQAYTLAKYQIYRDPCEKALTSGDIWEKRNNVKRDQSKIHCFGFSLACTFDKLGDEERKNKVESYFVGDGIKVYLPTHHFKKFCNILNINIQTHKMDERGYPEKSSIYLTDTPNDYTITVDLAIHRQHIFVFEEIEGIPQMLLDVGVVGTKRSHKKINSLKLVYEMERNGFIDLNFKTIEQYYAARDEDHQDDDHSSATLLRYLDQDQRLYQNRVKETKAKIVEGVVPDLEELAAEEEPTKPKPLKFCCDTETIKIPANNGTKNKQVHAKWSTLKAVEQCISIGWAMRTGNEQGESGYGRHVNSPDLHINMAHRMFNDMIRKNQAYHKSIGITPRTDRKKDDKYQNKIICEFHNLKFDLAVLQNSGLICESQLVNDGRVYNAVARYRGHVFEFRDTYKKVTLSLASAGKSFGTNHLKKEVIAYEYYSLDNYDMYGNHKRPTIDKYLSYIKDEVHSLSDYSTTTLFQRNKKHMLKVLSEDHEGDDVFQYEPSKQTFNAWAYYYHYMKYDCLTLRDVMNSFDSIVLNEIGVDSDKYLTAGAIQRAAAENFGCFEGVYEYQGGVRTWLSKFCVGGKTFCPPKYLKKRHGGPTEWKEHMAVDKATGEYIMVRVHTISGRIETLDGVSLYPSSVILLGELGYGAPLGPAKRIYPDLDFSKVSYYNVEIKITKVNRTCEVPKICTKVNGVLDYTNEVPQSSVYVDKIGLEELVNYHQIEYEVIDGIYWDEGFNTKGCEFNQKLFAMRLQAQKDKNTGLSEVLKLVLNSYYGKNIARKHVTKSLMIDRHIVTKPDANGDTFTHVDAGTKQYIFKNSKDVISARAINDKQAVVTLHTVDLGYSTMQEGIMILSASKRIMNEVFHVLEELHVPMFYTDTDSMHIYKDCIPDVADVYRKFYGKELLGNNLTQFHSDFKLKYIDENGDTKVADDVSASSSIVIEKKLYCDDLVGVRPKMVYCGEKDCYIPTKEMIPVIGYHIRSKGVNGAAISFKAKDLDPDESLKFGGNVSKVYDVLAEKTLKFNNVVDGGVPRFKIFNYQCVANKTTDFRTIGNRETKGGSK